MFGANDLHWIADFVVGADPEDEFARAAAPEAESRHAAPESDF